jgi:hypothetical protein
MPEGTLTVSPVSSPRSSFAASARRESLTSSSTDSLQRPSLEANRAGYSALPGPHQHGSTSSQLSARARRSTGQPPPPREEDPGKDNAAVLEPFDVNKGFAMMQQTQSITQMLNSVTQANQQYAGVVNGGAQQLMGIITTAVR